MDVYAHNLGVLRRRMVRLPMLRHNLYCFFLQLSCVFVVLVEPVYVFENDVILFDDPMAYCIVLYCIVLYCIVLYNIQTNKQTK